ncbi:hypothetical protein PENSTE_c006G01107 [Penicillium steckii]|uniref:Uncharacterized protein n=1 Tax=Penicillium steckii TaxID=303698 RepID=A0A1V6TGV0_9EURO|nr:hypothetical protein PENSTE_c006G01107 [Penicillium steckii]
MRYSNQTRLFVETSYYDFLEQQLVAAAPGLIYRSRVPARTDINICIVFIKALDAFTTEN